MVNRILVVVSLMLLLLSSCASAAPQSVEIQDAWARPAPQGGNGAVYLTIRSSTADEITGVRSDVARAVEMHESMMNGDVMQMHQLQSVPLPAGEQVTFEPGGLHIMLVGLSQDLKTGDEFEVHLRFKTYQEMTIQVPVQDTPASEHNH